MKATQKHHERIASMKFSGVYPHYVTKIQKKGRSEAELLQVIEWLTGYDQQQLESTIERQLTFSEFFEEAKINPKAELVTGVICGYRIEELDVELTRQVRVLDKLVDELAKGRKMEKILREG